MFATAVDFLRVELTVHHIIENRDGRLADRIVFHQRNLQERPDQIWHEAELPFRLCKRLSLSKYDHLSGGTTQSAFRRRRQDAYRHIEQGSVGTLHREIARVGDLLV